MGMATECGCKEVYRFPTLDMYLELLCMFLYQVKV